MSDFLRQHGLEPARHLCPWDSPGKNAGVGSISSSREIFPTQELNPGFLHCRRLLYHPSHQGLAGRFFTASATWEAVFGSQESDIEVSAGPGSFLPLPALCGPRPSLAASRDLLLRVSTKPTPAGKEEAVGGVLLPTPQAKSGGAWARGHWGDRAPRSDWAAHTPDPLAMPQCIPHHRADPGHPSLVLCGAPLLSLLQHSGCSWAQKFLRKHHLAPGSGLPLEALT